GGAGGGGDLGAHRPGEEDERRGGRVGEEPYGRRGPDAAGQRAEVPCAVLDPVAHPTNHAITSTRAPQRGQATVPLLPASTRSFASQPVHSTSLFPGPAASRAAPQVTVGRSA